MDKDGQFRTPRGFASEELRGLATKAMVDMELETLTLLLQRWLWVSFE